MESPTSTLHRLTSVDRFDEERETDPPVDDPRVVHSFTPLDLDRLPWFYKRFGDELPRLPLPRSWSRPQQSTLAALAGTGQPPAAAPTLEAVARLLHLSAGVTRTTERPYGTYLFRAAGSAGGRFPLEVYLVVPTGGPLPAGVFCYDPLRHELVEVAPPPSGGPVCVVVTGVPWRTAWKYRERGFRHVYWDCGTMLAQLQAAATSAGLPAHLFTRFPDTAVAELVGADGVHEWPVAVVALGDDVLDLGSARAAARGAIDARPVEFPLVTAAQRAGDGDTYGDPLPVGGPVHLASAAGGTVDEVVLRRGSQRLLDPDATVAADLMRTALEVSLRGVDVTHHVAVHRVSGVDPGLYRWPDLTRPVSSGDLREALYHACMDQGLGRDAAFVVMASAHLAGVDDRTYRELQLTAGLVEGRLHLAAYALGLAASGMTFVDGLLPDLLDDPDASGLLFTCVGTPQYRSRPGGEPGAPTEVRQVTPRF